jgi:hypothetical protein
MMLVLQLQVLLKTKVVLGQIQTVTVLDKDDACPTVPGLPEYNGCPKPAAVAVTEEFKDILFDFNKATINLVLS